MKRSIVTLLIFLATASLAFAEYGDIGSWQGASGDVLRITQGESVVLGSSTVRIVKELFPYASVSDSSSILSATKIDSLSATTMSHQPDCGARNLNIIIATYAMAGAATGSLTISGFDARMTPIRDVISLTTTTGDSIVSFATTQAYLVVDSATADATLKSYATYTDTITIGWGPALGLSCKPYGDTVISFIDTNNVGTNRNPPGTYNATYRTYTPASAVSGACVQVIYATQELGVKP